MVPEADVSAPVDIGDATTSDRGPQDTPIAEADMPDGGSGVMQVAASDATLLDAAEQLPCDAAVPLCIEYYEFESSCLHRDFTSLACQASLIPDGSDQLAQIISICQENLQRLQTACR